ncbi:MAG: hypothetical protein ACOYBY_07890, partial [Dermatophilaceae bacterium]
RGIRPSRPAATPPSRWIRDEGSTLPGCVFSNGGGGSRPLLIVKNGYDGSVETLYLANAVAALDRSCDVLVFDGPGQGACPHGTGSTFRPE